MKRAVLVSLLIVLMLLTQPASAWWWNTGPAISLSPTGTIKTTEPTTSVSFKASTSDSDGVKTISMYVDGGKVASKSCESCAWVTEKKCGWVTEKVRKCGWKTERVCKERYKCWYERKCGWKKECWNEKKYKCWYEKKCGWKRECHWVWDWSIWWWKKKCDWKYKCWNERKCGWKTERVCDQKYKCWNERKCGWKKECWNEKKYKCWYENERRYKCWNEEVYKCNYPSLCSLYKTASLKPGHHSVKVVAKDAKGATSSKTFHLSVIVDKPPSVSVSPSSRTYTVNNRDGKWHGKLTVRASDDIELDWVKVYVDGKLVKNYDCNPWYAGNKKSCSFSVNLKLSPGWHTIKAKAMDTGRHAKEATARFYIKADKPPAVSLSPPGGTFKAKGAYYKGTFTAKATDDVGLDSLKMYLDGKLQASKSYSCPWWNSFCSDKSYSLSKGMVLSPGTHVIKVVATDASGHTAVKQYTAIVKKDNPPAASLSPPGGTFKVNKDGKYVGKVTAYASDDSAVVSLKIYLDGSLKASSNCKPCWWCAASKSCSVSAKLEMSPGKHTVKVVAYDDGNQKAGRTYTFIIKDSPPTVSLSPPGGTFTSDVVEYITKSFTASASDDTGLDSVRMYLDGKQVAYKSCKPALWCFWCSPLKSCSVSSTLKLADGAHTIKVEAKDTAGNIASKSWDVEVIIDTLPFVGATPAGGSYTITEIPYELKYSAWASDDKGLEFLSLYVDGKEVNSKNCGKATTCTLVGSTYLSDGRHTVQVKAKDTAGHVASKSYTLEIVKKDEPPAINVYTTSYIPTTTDDASISVKATATDDVGVKSFTFYVDGVPSASPKCYGEICVISTTLKLDVGRHTLTFKAVDTANQVTTKSTTIDVVGAAIDLSFEKGAHLVPFFAEELPITIAVKKAPLNANIKILVNGQKMVKKTCSGSLCSYSINVPLAGLENKVGATKDYKIEVSVSYDKFSVTRTETITVGRSSSFLPGSEITIYVNIDKGVGPVTKLELKYGGKTYKPLYWPSALNDYERKVVKVPFRITSTESDYVTVKVCNAAKLCDVKKMKLLVGFVSTPSAKEPEAGTCNPSIKITTPEPTVCYPPGLNNLIELKYMATDTGTGDCGITKAELYVDGKHLRSTTFSGEETVSGSFTINTADFSQGSHTVKIVVTDRAGLTAEDTWTFEICEVVTPTPTPTPTPKPRDSIPVYLVGSKMGSAPYYIIGKYEGNYYYLGTVDPGLSTASAWNAARPVSVPQDGMLNIKAYGLTSFTKLGYYKWTGSIGSGNNAELHITNSLYQGYAWHVLSSYPVKIVKV